MVEVIKGQAAWLALAFQTGWEESVQQTVLSKPASCLVLSIPQIVNSSTSNSHNTIQPSQTKHCLLLGNILATQTTDLENFQLPVHHWFPGLNGSFFGQKLIQLAPRCRSKLCTTSVTDACSSVDKDTYSCQNTHYFCLMFAQHL